MPHSRYLLRCQALARTDTEHVWPVLDAAFREFGLPLRLRSDNGPPFASTGAGGLSRLSVKLIKAGVPSRAHRARQAAAERPPGAAASDLLQDTASPPAASLREQLERLRASSGSTTRSVRTRRSPTRRPAKHYQPLASRRFDGILREPDYGADHAVRRVRHNGEIKWQGNTDLYQRQRLPASRSGFAKTRTAAGPSATDRSCSASSRIAATA